MPARKKSSRSPRRTQTYAQAGVDIAAGDALVEHLKTINPAIGGFSGLTPLPRGYKKPRLVAATDGVGTKLLVAQLARVHQSIGIDLVAMSVNDLIVCGARPLFFLDYFATGKLKNEEARAVIDGVVEGCNQSGCPLIGGETAEMPGMYAPGHYDLAGFCVGIVDADNIVDGRNVKPGDLILGFESSGLHSNGYSLARQALLPEGSATARRALKKKLFRGGPTVAEAMLAPTKIYVKPVLDLMKRFEIKAAAHITGGGVAGNLVRVLPKGVRACIDVSTWDRPPIFDAIAQQGPVDADEMFKVFNMGVGFIMIVDEKDAKKAVRRAAKLGESVRVIGWVDAQGRPGDSPEVVLMEPTAG